MTADEIFKELGYKKITWKAPWEVATYQKINRHIFINEHDKEIRIENNQGLTWANQKEREAMELKLKEWENVQSNYTDEITRP